MRPARALPSEPPKRLARRQVAAAVWRRVMREYGSIEAEIVTRLDMDHLIDYCILVEECMQLDEMRTSALAIQRAMDAKYQALMESGELEEALAMSNKVLGAQEAVTKIDARKDRKLDLIKKWRESLYITPRARAGTAPAQKEKEQAPDDMELLLMSDAVEILRHGGEA